MLNRYFAPAIVLLACFSPASQAQTPTVIQDARQPQLAVAGGKGVFLVAGRSSDILLWRSDDSGATFGEPVTVGGFDKLALGMRRGPRVAVTPDRVLVAAIGGEKQHSELMLWASEDGGASFDDGRRLNSVAESAREGLFEMDAAGEHVAVVWLDLRNDGKTEIYGAFSKDGGASFGPDRMLYASPSGSVCECCCPAVDVAEDGQVAVMFRNNLDGNRDMYVMTSPDGGASFGPAVKQGTQSWKLDACPMDGGDVGIDGEVTAVWRRENQISGTNMPLDKPSSSKAPERPIGTGRDPQLTIGMLGTFVTWVGADGQILLRGPLVNEAITIAESGSAPAVAWLPDPKEVLLAWENEGNINLVRTKGRAKQAKR